MKFLFPTVIHEAEVPNFDQDTCVKIARQLKKEDPKGVIKSNITGWQSDFIYPNSNDYFTNVISNTLSNYFDGQKIFKNFKLNIQGYWVNINQPGAFNNMHDHPDSHLAGVIWIKTNEESGKLQFRNPTSFGESRILNLYDKEFAKNHDLHVSYYINPLSGGCILFPSHLNHWVTLNKSKEERISISFNLYLEE